jgi:hypothetical protein
MMGAAGLALGVSCCLAALFTSMTHEKRRDYDDTLLAFALAWVWSAAMGAQIITGAMGALEGRVMRFEFGAIIDLAFGMMIVSCIRKRSSKWKWTMAALNALALVADVGFLLSERTREIGNTCKFALNAVFIAQLACICFPGVADVIRRDRLRLFHRLHSRPLERVGSGR